jgi:hypothetical protein
VINKLGRLAEVLFSEELDEEPKDDSDAVIVRKVNAELLTRWKNLSNNQLKLWKLLEQHTDYSTEDLDQLHYFSNQFMSQWIDLLERIT